MGHKIPFAPTGNCVTCKFSRPVYKGHHQAAYHSLVCHRFPPTGATSAPGDGPWSHKTFVHDIDYCAEYRYEGNK